jgi:hypothetical protein
MSHALIAK